MCILVIFCYPDFFAAEAQQNFAECSPKLLITETIDDRVTNGIPILEPFDYLSNYFWQFHEPLTSSGHFDLTHGISKIEGEKRSPAEHKKTDDNSHCCSNAQILKSKQNDII